MELNEDDGQELVELPYTTTPKLLDRNEEIGREVWYHFEGEELILNTRQSVEPILKVNQAFYNETYGERWGEGKRVASVPINFFWDKLHEAVMNKDDAYIRKFLNNSDHKKFRTFHGPNGKI